MTTKHRVEVPREALASYIGKSREAEIWMKITQEMIDAFADATFDHQFIHVDPEKARPSAPRSRMAKW